MRPSVPNLLDLCAEQVFSSGINFFHEEIPESLKYYMSLIYLNYNICNFCNVATNCLKSGILIIILALSVDLKTFVYLKLQVTA